MKLSKEKITLSICIPTYNRVFHLENCLNSISLAKDDSSIQLEVCVSDNNSEEEVIPIINRYKDKLNLIFNKNNKNIGMGGNIIKSVSISSGDFVWILGNDDIILPDSLNHLELLINNNKDIDFYYINSFNADENLITEHPVNTKKINLSLLNKFSSYKKNEKLNFFELIDPRKSFEFMLSMNLCVFRRVNWIENLDVIDLKKILDTELYSNFDNTAPHIKIWSKAFMDKKAYFFSKPLSINVHGPRSQDWGHLYPFVEAVRTPQVLDCYRKDGLSFFRYIICKSFALRRFFPSFYRILKDPKKTGFKYINIYNDIISNLIYPSIYICGIFFLVRRIFIIIKNFIFKFFEYFILKKND